MQGDRKPVRFIVGLRADETFTTGGDVRPFARTWRTPFEAQL
jgi:hypothetical protein